MKNQYRKKPIIVEAEGPITEPRVISTLEGEMKADVGDFIITGVNGEKYPCKPDIFHKTYEQVDENGRPWHPIVSHLIKSYS